MAVAPCQAERIVAHRADVAELEVTARLDEADRPFVALALRARAVTAQALVRVDAAVPVGELDLHDARAARGADQDRHVAIVVGAHASSACIGRSSPAL